GPRHSSDEAGEQSEESPLRRRLRGRSQRCRWSEGRGPRGIRPSKARTGLRARVACQRRWSVYGDLCRYPPEAGAVCGKAARTDLGGGRAMKRTSLPLQTRRAFVRLLGGAAAAWPLGARAQQRSLLTIGFLDIRSPDAMADRLRGFRQGLAETGYVEGDNVTIVYRWAENKIDQVPELVADLVRRQVAVMLVSGRTSAALSAKAATATPPILFLVGDDPVRLGLVASLARPGGNLTGINFFNTELVAKQLAFLHEVVPRAVRVAVFVNPTNAPNTEATERNAPSAARAMGLQLQMLRASTSREIDAAFTAFAREPPDAVF